METQNMESLIPAAVYSALTPEQTEEFDQVLNQLSTKEMFLYPIDKLKTTNPGLWYLALQSPMKYSLVSLAIIPEDKLLSLLDFDFTRLDPYHKLMWERDPEQGLWEQKFSIAMAAFGNPNLTGESVDRLLTDLHADSPADISIEDLLQTVGYQLLDKWNPEDFNADVLLELVKSFEFHGITEYLPKFKHLQRAAAKTR